MELLNNKEFLRLAFHNSGNAIFVVDDNLTIVELNNDATNLTGIGWKYIDNSFLDIILPTTKDDTEAKLRKAFEENECEPIEIYIDTNGSTKLFEVKCCVYNATNYTAGPLDVEKFYDDSGFGSSVNSYTTDEGYINNAIDPEMMVADDGGKHNDKES